jgi:hypothetical protein
MIGSLDTVVDIATGVFTTGVFTTGVFTTGVFTTGVFTTGMITNRRKRRNINRNF